MTISEPMTLLTDYALAAVSAWLGFRLVGTSRFWALAFFALAAAALLGGTWHGFLKSDFLWTATTLCVGVASFGMVTGSALAVMRGWMLRGLIALAILKFAAYTIWMIGHDDFIWVIADTASALVIVGLLHLWRFNAWMLAGVAVSILAGAVQASGLALHRHFNHNDLYHVIQIVAMLLLYRGVKRF
jgi:hypothetical protein